MYKIWYKMYYIYFDCGPYHVGRIHLYISQDLQEKKENSSLSPLKIGRGAGHTSSQTATTCWILSNWAAIALPRQFYAEPGLEGKL